jgi:alcohol dehydrogenase YqhD (iron-dependent ADH family)
MHNFEWSLPTRIVYGPGEVARLGELTAQFGKKVFLVTYQGEEKLAGVLKAAVASLENQGLEVVIYDRIEPNPRVTTVDEGVKQFLDCGAEVLVAFGGGSVIDATKHISSVAYSGGSSWDYVVLSHRKAKEYTGAYPILAVPTVSAAGSEANAGGVITNWETNEKSFSRSPYRIPKVAIIDPELLASVPRNVTADGGVDIFSHLIEHYLSSPSESEIADRITEGIILALIDNLKRVLQDGGDLEARGQVALCSLLGWSGVQAVGRLGSIPIHFIEHQLSGHYDISHGRGMAVILPAFLSYFAEEKPERWAKLARRVFGVTEGDDLKAAKALSGKVEAWLADIQVPSRLSGAGIGSEKFEQMADDIVRMYSDPDSGTVYGPRPMSREDILEVLKRSL